ncbi:solute carrier family 26 member 10-like [Contarinia nasturtii]|uniref:solute carrier family 26 member 10-like n=1 Tax=Contarinia nasturtii TaxID=265458 RepID=UPI0012D44215|nr:solute carrier family 26 member 10-like [Contarinia nasturtii]
MINSSFEHSPSDGGVVLKVERPFYEQHQFNSALDYKSKNDKKPVCSNPLSCLTNFNPATLVKSMIPILSWLPRYKFKEDLVCDLISGFTVGIMHIPQGMGYALLGSVPPIVGIYTAFFPVLLYFLLGTSRHNSMGTFSVISIMVGKVVMRYAQNPSGNITMLHNSTSIGAEPLDHPVYTPMHVVSSLCIVMAGFHLIMYVMRFGVLSSLLSESLVSGFTTGAAVGVLTSQVKDLLGIKLTPVIGKFEIVLNWYEVICKILDGSCNSVTVGISVVTITILWLNNEWLKPKWSKFCIVPIPIQLIAAVSGTLASRYLDLHKNFNITTVGDIPTGIPDFQLPDFDLSRHLIVDGLIIAIVSYVISVSVALTFAQRMSYEIDFNQELLALGTANIVGSCFSCLPLCASLSRSTVQVLAGGRTQITSIVSCSILFFVLLWIGPFFEVLPKCVLASIIVVALKTMLMQVVDFFKFWKISRLDALIWMSTFLAVVIVSIDIGLLVGIILSLACIFMRAMTPARSLLGNVPNTDIYLDINRYKAAKEINSIKIFHYSGSLNFASRSSLKMELCSLIGLDLPTELRNLSKGVKCNHLKCLIIDFAALSYIDPSGVSTLKLLIDDFNKLSVNVYIAGASCSTYEMMKRCGLNERSDGSFNFFPAVHDAVHRAKDNLNKITNIITEISPKNIDNNIVHTLTLPPASGIYRTISNT